MDLLACGRLVDAEYLRSAWLDRVRVLIADDQRLFAEALEAILTTDGRIVVVGRAANGEEAVALARDERPDVVLMDIAMPVLDGIAATEAISAQAPDTRVVVLTGSDAPDDISRARAAGASRLRDEGPDRGRPRPRDPRRGRALATLLDVLPVFSVIHVLLSAALVGLILMHSGRDTGMGGMGFTPASQGGTHIVERNLTRLTLVIAVLFFANTVLLFRLLK